MVAPPIVKKTQKTVTTSIWSCQEYPISLKQFLPLLELLAKLSKKANKLRDFFRKSSLLEQIVFPIKAKVPLFLSVKAAVRFEDLSLKELPSSVFDIKYAVSPVTLPEERVINLDGPLRTRCLTEEDENIEERYQNLDLETKKFTGPRQPRTATVQPVSPDSGVECPDGDLD